MRTSSEIDVRRCRDWICSAFQISSSRYSCVRFMMYSIHHRFRKTSLTIVAIARSRQISGMSSARFFGTGKWMLLDNYLIRALTGDHSAYKQKEAEATQCTQTGYAPVDGL